MLTSTFYKLINEELEQILDKNPDDQELHHHRDREQNKGYAFLIWFLDFYGQQKLYKNYITDGSDDSSCDIIFSNTDSQGQTVFYVVQSKWISMKINEEGQLLRKKKPIQVFPQIGKEEFNAVISDFTTVANGTRKPGRNERFNKKYEELIAHLEDNGKAKFIFFAAADYNEAIKDNVNSFIKEYAPNITLEVIDIERIKRDYIEFKFKEIVVNNPLEYSYSPEDTDIALEIERYKNGSNGEHEYKSSRDLLQFEGRTQAYIFTLKPKTIHQLFQKYKFKLFFKNVRNPLHASNYNEKIVETLQRRPDTFWYFNNGITAITKRIPDVGKSAKILTVKGLQVINGAQTVYSVYQAYESASLDEREIMDADARISFRLIRSSDEDFNMEITRFTNSQNAMEPRDFVANLEEQRRLQNESFKTRIWYEKRRGEFRLEKEKLKELGIEIVSNEIFAKAYVAFHLQRPTLAAINSHHFFLRRTESESGLYEHIFTEQTKFEDMLGALYFWFTGKAIIGSEPRNEALLGIANELSEFLLIALAKVVLQKHLTTVKDSRLPKNVNEFLKQIVYDNKEDNIKLVFQAMTYTLFFLFSKLAKDNGERTADFIGKLSSSQASYDIFRQQVEDEPIDLNAFDFKEKAPDLKDLIQKHLANMLNINK